MGSAGDPRASDPRPSDDWDNALPFQLDALGVRGRLVRLGPSLDGVIERHGYPLAVARPLAEAMVLCATLATSLKYDGIFTLQLTGDGPIRLLVTDLTSDGALRGVNTRIPDDPNAADETVALGVSGRRVTMLYPRVGAQNTIEWAYVDADCGGSP